MQKQTAFHRIGQTRACCPGLHRVCWGPHSPHLTLLLFAAVDGKFYEAGLRFTTNPNEWKPERRGKRKRKQGAIAEMTLTGHRSDMFAKTLPCVSQLTPVSIRHRETVCILLQTRLSLILLFPLCPVGRHRSQPKCNWTTEAAWGLSLSLITNYNRGQLQLPRL